MTPKQKSAIYYATYKRKVIDRHMLVRQKCADYIVSVKNNKPCADCGVVYAPHIMDFDHVVGKKQFNISCKSEYTSLERVQREIAKCDIVCSNCHRERTYQRLHLTE